MPANSCAIGTTYKLRAEYRFAKTTSPPTLTFRLTVAGVAIATLIVTSVSSATTSGGFVEGTLTVRTTGAGGTCMGSLFCTNDHGITSAVNWTAQAVPVATSAIDTTLGAVIAIDGKMTTAVASNTLTFALGYVELVKT